MIRLTSKMYTLANYDIKYVLNNNLNSMQRNPLGRVANAFAYALNNFECLPRLVVFILEDDIINFVKYEDFGLTKLYTLLMQWLMAEVKRLLTTYKSFLPAKAKENNLPHLIWIAPTLHKNYDNNGKRKKIHPGHGSSGCSAREH